MAGSERAYLGAAVLFVGGFPLLGWLASNDLVLGNTWVLALLLPLMVLVSSGSYLATTHLDGHPTLRLVTGFTLLAAFCWIAGWSFALPALTVLLTVRMLNRTDGRLWAAAAAIAGGFTTIGQVGVALDLLPSVVDHSQSHLAAALLLVIAWSATAVVARDAAERHRSEHALARADARLRALMDSSTDVLTVSTADGVLSYVSPAAERAMGYLPEDLIGRHLLDLVDTEHQDEVHRLLTELAAEGPDARATMDVLAVHATLERRWYEWTFHNLLHDLLVQGIVVQLRDVSERLQAQRDLAHAASHDDLTGLPNRGELLRRMAISLPQAGPGASVAVLFVDLDLFKDVNDRLGHQAGDDVLTVVARRLASSVRSHDHLGRLGGDEFGVLLTEVRDESEVAAIIERLVAAIERPITLASGAVQVGASVGHAITSDPLTPLDRLLATADQLMYAKKGQRRR